MKTTATAMTLESVSMLGQESNALMAQASALRLQAQQSAADIRAVAGQLEQLDLGRAIRGMRRFAEIARKHG